VLVSVTNAVIAIGSILIMVGLGFLVWYIWYFDLMRGVRENDYGEDDEIDVRRRNSSYVRRIMNRLEKIPYSPMIFADEDPEHECVICLDFFKESADVVQLPCAKSHIFHYECLKQWVERERWNQSKCPICRRPIEQ
jgi:hypothetical protein